MLRKINDKAGKLGDGKRDLDFIVRGTASRTPPSLACLLLTLNFASLSFFTLSAQFNEP